MDLLLLLLLLRLLLLLCEAAAAAAALAFAAELARFSILRGSSNLTSTSTSRTFSGQSHAEQPAWISQAPTQTANMR